MLAGQRVLRGLRRIPLGFMLGPFRPRDFEPGPVRRDIGAVIAGALDLLRQLANFAPDRIKDGGIDTVRPQCFITLTGNILETGSQLLCNALKGLVDRGDLLRVRRRQGGALGGMRLLALPEFGRVPLIRVRYGGLGIYM